MLPGLTDPHVHFADGGAHMMHRVDCRNFYANIRSVAQIVEAIKEQAERQPPGTGIVAHGSPMQNFRMPEKRFPYRRDLDAATPNHPVSINFGAHITIANSKALELAGVNAATPAPAGGAIEFDVPASPPASSSSAPSSWCATWCRNTPMGKWRRACFSRPSVASPAASPNSESTTIPASAPTRS